MAEVPTAMFGSRSNWSFSTPLMFGPWKCFSSCYHFPCGGGFIWFASHTQLYGVYALRNHS